jgi:hypothetical protein
MRMRSTLKITDEDFRGLARNRARPNFLTF